MFFHNNFLFFPSLNSHQTLATASSTLDRSGEVDRPQQEVSSRADHTNLYGQATSLPGLLRYLTILHCYLHFAKQQ